MSMVYVYIILYSIHHVYIIFKCAIVEIDYLKRGWKKCVAYYYKHARYNNTCIIINIAHTAATY